VPFDEAEQHPVGHGDEALHAKLQMPSEHPCAPDAQSAIPVHPHWPPPLTASHACPCVLPAHELHTPPLFPHAVGEVPAEHELPLQHPPLHGDNALQVVEHCPPLQAMFAGHSAALVHPQVPPGTQRCPFAEVVQLAQTPPPVPHTAFAVPPAHWPEFVTSQHPPLHANVLPPAVQNTLHWPLLVLHASPIGQSPVTLHPHAPPLWQTWPSGECEQSTHASTPVAWQSCPPALPATHFPVPVASQHPPLHVST